MSSVLSAFAEVYKLPTKFSSLITPSFQDSTIVSGETLELPIPFTVANQVLDINVNQSADIQAVVNNGTEPRDQSNIQGKSFGGERLVTSLGASMTTYLRNWINQIETLGSAYAGPLVVYIQPVMTKVQLANPAFAIPNEGAFERDRSWGITTEAPVSTEYTGGGSANNFFTVWIFKTPMTVQYVAPGGGFKYITLTSQFAEE
jgi:hypothetical protein